MSSDSKPSAFKRFLATDARQKGDLWRAAWALLQAKLRVNASDKKSITSGYTLMGSLPPLPEVSDSQAERVQELVWAVRAVGRRVPWNSVCLDQAIALQQLMQPIPGAIVLGAHQRESAEQGRSLAAHAWLVCGSRIVLGESGHEDFAVLGVLVWGVANNTSGNGEA